MAKTLALSRELPPFIDYMPYCGEGYGHLTLVPTLTPLYSRVLSAVKSLALPILVGLWAYYSFLK